MTKEALTLALEALELAGGNLCEALHHPKKLQHGIGEPCPAVAKYDQAITAIKEALAQPKQEQQIETLKRCLFQMQEAAKNLVEQAKSLTPPQSTWVGLTDEERNSLYEAHHDKYNLPNQGSPDGMDYERAIEAKLMEKNF